MAMPTPAVDVILVPQGFEHRAVVSSIGRTVANAPMVAAIPIGQAAQARRLQELIITGLLPPASRILLIGLGGALREGLPVGEFLLIGDCGERLDCGTVVWSSCDVALTASLAQALNGIPTGRLITIDAVVSRSSEKRRLGVQSGADMVDMEGFRVLNQLRSLGHQVAILRVVSDACDQDLPDLAAVVSPGGALQVMPLLMAFLKRPKAAIRLVRGSLQALRQLRLLTHQLFGDDVGSDA
jgi:nucleoside phosphorylase